MPRILANQPTVFDKESANFRQHVEFVYDGPPPNSRRIRQLTGSSDASHGGEWNWR